MQFGRIASKTLKVCGCVVRSNAKTRFEWGILLRWRVRRISGLFRPNPKRSACVSVSAQKSPYHKAAIDSGCLSVPVFLSVSKSNCASRAIVFLLCVACFGVRAVRLDKSPKWNRLIRRMLVLSRFLKRIFEVRFEAMLD